MQNNPFCRHSSRYRSSSNSSSSDTPYQQTTAAYHKSSQFYFTPLFSCMSLSQILFFHIFKSITASLQTFQLELHLNFSDFLFIFRVRNWALKFGVDLWEFGRQFTKMNEIRNVSIYFYFFTHSKGKRQVLQSVESLKLFKNLFMNLNNLLKKKLEI